MPRLGWLALVAMLVLSAGILSGSTEPSSPYVGGSGPALGMGKPVPTLTPIATPTPTATPPAPAGIAVPSSIDATGASDVSTALINFIGTVPDGSTIVFKAGGTYRVDKAIKFANRANLTLNGNGATLRGHGGTTEASSIFWLDQSGGVDRGITIENFSMVGNDPSPGVYSPGSEGAHGVLVVGGTNIEVVNVTISAIWGDCLFVGSWPTTVATGVTFRDSTCASAGRQGVTITSGSNVTVERVSFPKSGYCTFDIEPNFSYEVASNIKFLDNTVGTWSNSFLSADGAAGSSVSGVTVSGNTVTGGTLLTIIDLARRSNIVFTNNTSTVKGYGPILNFAHIDGLTVTGNVQPLSGGSLTSITDSTSVTTQ
jgi:Right handed beta helix region